MCRHYQSDNAKYEMSRGLANARMRMGGVGNEKGKASPGWRLADIH
jgi:hypothetical protein